MPQSKTWAISIIGLGYVGLSTAACLASRGFNVTGVDIDKEKVAALKKGVSTIHEEGLDSLLRRSLVQGTLHLRSNYDGLERSKIVFITVGTPSRQDGRVDLEYVEAAAKQIGRQLELARGYRLVVVKSTVKPGTTDGLVRHNLEKESRKEVGPDFGLASNPEFLHEGSAIRETLHPEAVVIGGHDKRSVNTLLKMYDAFYGRRPPTIITTPSNAEMMKYAINAGRATQVSFVNTIANYCTRVPGCDYDEVRKGLSVVARMDERYLGAGVGFGGSCLPKDCRALASELKSSGVRDEVVTPALRVNDGQVGEAIRLAERLCGSLDGKRVSILGLAFKAGTDDIRESVPLALVKALVRKGAELTVFDPAAMENTRGLLGKQVAYAKSPKDALRGSECAFIATGWEAFKKLRPSDFKGLMATPVVVDGRRIYDQRKFTQGGVRIATIGTGPQHDVERGGARSTPKLREWHYVVTDGEVRSGHFMYSG
jgi:UDPglucose 6-dehydrogenase